MTAPNSPGGVVRRLHEVVALHGDRTAVIDGDRRLSYRAFLAEVERRAAKLTEAGLVNGARVALVAENSVDYLTTVFAIWLARGVPATIYPSTARSELEFSLASSDPALVLTQRSLIATVQKVAPGHVPVASIDGDFDVANVRAADDPHVAGPHAPVFLICYSSGTTSRPKAIMLSEEAVLNGAMTYGELWHFEPNDVVVVCLPMAWVFGLVTTAAATLFRGGTVLSLPRSKPELLTSAISEHRATCMTGVTTIYAKCASHLDAWDTSVAPRPDLSSLRLCISGGEPRNEAAFDRWSRHAGVPVHDNFCASECFPLITYDPHVDPQPVRGAAGRLAPRSRLRIVDPEGRPVPVGEVGEALSSGPGLMLGYWGEPELSRQALTEDGWYRTKDLVRMDADGLVYVVGRLSDMIIRGGSNVSPAEVESTLREHPSIGDVAVVGLSDETYGQEVVAAVLTTDPSSFNADAVRSWAKQRLAPYKVPTRYFIVPDLPTSATTGKVDRRAVAASLNPNGAV